MLGLKIFVRVQTFRRRSFAQLLPPCLVVLLNPICRSDNFCIFLNVCLVCKKPFNCKRGKSSGADLPYPAKSRKGIRYAGWKRVNQVNYYDYDDNEDDFKSSTCGKESTRVTSNLLVKLKLFLHETWKSRHQKSSNGKDSSQGARVCVKGAGQLGVQIQKQTLIQRQIWRQIQRQRQPGQLGVHGPVRQVLCELVALAAELSAEVKKVIVANNHDDDHENDHDDDHDNLQDKTTPSSIASVACS